MALPPRPPHSWLGQSVDGFEAFDEIAVTHLLERLLEGRALRLRGVLRVPGESRSSRPRGRETSMQMRRPARTIRAPTRHRLYHSSSSSSDGVRAGLRRRGSPHQDRHAEPLSNKRRSPLTLHGPPFSSAAVFGAQTVVPGPASRPDRSVHRDSARRSIPGRPPPSGLLIRDGDHAERLVDGQPERRASTGFANDHRQLVSAARSARPDREARGDRPPRPVPPRSGRDRAAEAAEPGSG